MTIFFTADTHFGDHRTINIHRRPFASVAAMDEAIVAGWNETVGPDDEVWHLGDVARRSADVAALLAGLNGIKHLVRGNNDDPATGDATEDLATFLSPAMQWLYRGRVLSPPETEAFLAAYPDPAVTARYLRLQPLYRWRMAAHCLWKADRGAPDYRHALALELAP